MTAYKIDMANYISAVEDVSLSKASKILNSCFEFIADRISEGEKVVVTGFGTFEPRWLEASSGFDPNGNRYSVPKRMTVRFRPSVNVKRGLKEMKSF